MTFKDYSNLDRSEINSTLEKIQNIKKEAKNFSFFKNDKFNFDEIKNLVSKKLNLNPKILVVIGIGGSNLGTQAIQEAIFGQLYNQNAKLKVFYADTVDSEYISQILNLCEYELKSGCEVILNVISKSGVTTETIANFSVFYDLLKKYKLHNFNENIVITTDKNSQLWKFGKLKNIDCLEIPKDLGGRYSVFSAVGLFPLMLLNLDVQKIIDGVQAFDNDFFNDSSIAEIRAATIYLLYKKGFNVNDLFIFYKNLFAYGLWYRQLMAESLGKEFNIKNEKVNIDLSPTVSVGTTDLHSVGQLYLASKNNQFTTFISVKNSKENIKIPSNKVSDLVENIEDKNFSELMNIILQGVQEAYKKRKLPFFALELDSANEYMLGYLMQSNMAEISLVGKLLEINPFDQPNVELYKKEVHKLLQDKK